MCRDGLPPQFSCFTNADFVTVVKRLVIVQARTGSTRLPGKVVKDICGHPMLWHQIQRAKLATSLDQIVLATTEQPEDEAVTYP